MNRKLWNTFGTIGLCAILLSGCSNTQPDSSSAETPTEIAASGTPTSAPSADPNTVLYSDKVSVPANLLAHKTEPTDTGDIVITDAMRKAAIINQCNITRLADAMVKAANGEEVTIAYIGGSITDGSLANPQATKCYAYLSTEWWKSTFPDAKINYVNAGIGATDSYLGVHRVEKDVLSKKPDVVIVEFSVNDYKTLNKESYESLLRRILQSETSPAVISLYLTQENGSDYQSNHQVISYNLQVPMISYHNVLVPAMNDGSIAWSQVGAPDGTHPNNGGHAVIAHLLTNFFNTVLEQIPTMAYQPYEVPDRSQTQSRYEQAHMEDNQTISPAASDQFSTVTIANAQFPNGWRTTTGGSISFEVTGKNFGLVFYGTQDGKSGQFEIYIDDEYIITLDANFVGKWGSYADYTELKKFKEEGTHTIRIQKAPDSTGDQFTILALTIS